MTRWQRPVRFALGLFALGFAAFVVVSVRDRGEDEGARAQAPGDPAVIQESTEGTITDLRGFVENFSLQYGRRQTFEGGLTTLEDVTIDVRNRASRDFTLSGREARIADGQSTLEVRRDVRLAASDGLVVEAQEATYDGGTGIITVPGPLTFSSGRFGGTAVGATYDQPRDVLWLRERPRVTVRDPAGHETLVTSGSAGFARRDRYLRFESGVTMTQGGQVVEALNAVAYLAPVEDELEALELRGGSRVTRVGAGPGELRQLAATDMNLVYQEGRQLERATLAGQSSVRLAGPVEDTRLAARSIDLRLAPDGATLTGLAAREAVELDLPAAGETPARRIESATMEARGTPEDGLTAARFEREVVFREGGAGGSAGSATRRVTADTLDTVLTGALASLGSARFGGSVAIRDGTLEAASDLATYDPAAGTMELRLDENGRGGEVRVSDDRMTIVAREIDVGLADDAVGARGEVKTVLAPVRQADGAEARPPVRRSSLLEDDAPVNVTAGRLDYHGETGVATYRGEARLWQGDTTVQGETIVLDDRTGNLTSDGSVRSSMMLEEVDERTQARRRTRSIATSEHLTYDDAARVATYSTTARMVGPQGDLQAVRIELHLEGEGAALERVEAFDEVTLRSDRRTATGVRMTYFDADERYVMWGSPVRILEQLVQECRETLGKTLTFFRSTDTILVDGNEESRTQTKSGGKCPEPPGG